MMFIKLLLTFSCLFFIQTLYAEKFIVNTQEWFPYQTYQGDQFEGTATNTVKCILNHMKLDYQINVLPWQRAQEEVKSGHAQAFYSAGITDERNTYAIASNKINSYKWIWYLLINSPFDPKSPDFKQKAEVATKFGTALETYLIKNKYHLVSSPKEVTNLFEMLEAKRFDAFLSPEESAIEAMKKMKLDKKKFKIIFHSNNSLVFYFSKKYVSKNKNIVNQFNSFIKVCSTSN